MRGRKLSSWLGLQIPISKAMKTSIIEPIIIRDKENTGKLAYIEVFEETTKEVLSSVQEMTCWDLGSLIDSYTRHGPPVDVELSELGARRLPASGAAAAKFPSVQSKVRHLWVLTLRSKLGTTGSVRFLPVPWDGDDLTNYSPNWQQPMRHRVMPGRED
ncbi:hypothetical protein F5887DRAFT_1164193 [Amanita rubescens]|nr:hypothetical protein F5887DRAFT_1164193 [Amanita rubescens]